MNAPDAPISTTICGLADAANISQEGKLNILGEFNRIRSPTVPVAWPYMVFVAVLELSDAAGDAFDMELRVVLEDGDLVHRATGRLEVDRSPEPGERRRVPLIVPIGNATFGSFGKYTFELRLNAQHVCSAHVAVQKVSAARPQA